MDDNRLSTGPGQLVYAPNGNLIQDERFSYDYDERNRIKSWTKEGTLFDFDYDNLGNLTDNIKVGTHIDQIEMGPSGERLFATSRQNKTVEIIRLDFINAINSEGSVFKGPANAPVTIAVFSEFQ